MYTKDPDDLRMPQIVKNKGPMSIIISTQENIQGLKTKKRTASFQGELNFNDFKAGSQADYLSQLDCLSRQIPLEKDSHSIVINKL